MGTTLTGTTPQDTYDSLIKVTDNGPLSGTAKYLSDGLGNDSALAVSTAAVGIGTNTPSEVLQVSKTQSATTRLQITNAQTGGSTSVRASLRVTANDRIGEFVAVNGDSVYVGAASNHTTALMSNGAGVLYATPAGNVGIGAAAPSYTLQVRGASAAIAIDRTSGNQPKLAFTASGSEYASIISSALNGENRFSIGPDAGWGGYHTFYTNTAERFRITNNGVTFNGDTAAANALDDYEEGTFTLTATPNTSGSITLNPNTCSYTKIGRQVTIRGNVVVGSVSSPVGTLVVLGGLPFTSLNSVSARGAGTAMYFPTVGSSVAPINYQLSNAVEWNLILTASSVVAGDEFYISLTYFV